MKLHDLKNTFERSARKRVGRGDGSGTGKTSGRGGKGDSARNGFAYRGYFEGGQIPFFRRLPKRGFNNPNHREFSVVNVGLLEQAFAAGDEVDLAALRAKGLVGKKVRDGLKILGDGELTKALTVKAEKFSGSAKAKIEAAGGTVEIG